MRVSIRSHKRLSPTRVLKIRSRSRSRSESRGRRRHQRKGKSSSSSNSNPNSKSSSRPNVQIHDTGFTKQTKYGDFEVKYDIEREEKKQSRHKSTAQPAAPAPYLSRAQYYLDDLQSDERRRYEARHERYKREIDEDLRKRRESRESKQQTRSSPPPPSTFPSSLSTRYPYLAADSLQSTLSSDVASPPYSTQNKMAAVQPVSFGHAPLSSARSVSSSVSLASSIQDSHSAVHVSSTSSVEEA